MATQNALNNNLANCTGLPVTGLSTTGTASSTTYLSGTGVWSTPAGSAKGLLNVQYLTASSGTYTKTSGTVSIVVYAISGGGGGGNSYTDISSNKYASSGGGGGAFAQKYYATAPSTASYTIGSGGAGAAASPVGNASSGGSTTFNGDINITGGDAGFNYNSTYISSLGGKKGSGDTSDVVFPGQASCAIVTPYTGIGVNQIGPAGACGNGSGGGYTSSLGNGVTPTGYGGGGSGTPGSASNNTYQAGGNGAPGLLIIMEYGA